MKIPFNYIFRNLWTRKLTTLLTAGGMALVVFVFAAVLMLDAGLRRRSSRPAAFDNAILLRPSAQTEIQSSVYARPGLAGRDHSRSRARHDGAPLSRRKILVLTQIPRKGSDRPPTSWCAAASAGLALRPQVKIVEGACSGPARRRSSSGRGIADGFEGVEIGSAALRGTRMDRRRRLRRRQVGFDSELWGDVEQMMQAFRRTTYSSAVVRLQTAPTSPRSSNASPPTSAWPST
jgi:hypothetical protein